MRALAMNKCFGRNWLSSNYSFIVGVDYKLPIWSSNKNLLSWTPCKLASIDVNPRSNHRSHQCVKVYRFLDNIGRNRRSSVEVDKSLWSANLDYLIEIRGRALVGKINLCLRVASWWGSITVNWLMPDDIHA